MMSSEPTEPAVTPRVPSADALSAWGSSRAAALTYGELGLRVIPLRADRKPALAKWPERASSDAAEITRLWTMCSDVAGVGILTGESNPWVLDVDVKNGKRGDDELAALVAQHGPLPETVTVRTGTGGSHLYFAPDPRIRRSGSAIAPGLDVLGYHSFVVAPPTVNLDTGKAYTFDIGSGFADLQPAQAPDWLVKLAIDASRTATNGTRKTVISGAPIPDGDRDATLTSIAGSLRRVGLSENQMAAALRQVNVDRCQPPLPDASVCKIARSVARYTAGEIRVEVPRVEVPRVDIGAPVSLADVRAVVAKWLLIEDQTLVPIFFGTVFAHLHNEDEPVWTMIIGPPGSAKTEFLLALRGLEETYYLSELTARTFASGLDRPGKADPSLLHRLSNQILIFKDFTTVLELRHEDRTAIFAQLREIYDGNYSKDWGTGRSLKWQGRLGFIAGVTAAIDSHQAAMAVLGERFITYRPKMGGRKSVAHKAARQRGQRGVLQAELRDYFHRFISQRRSVPVPAFGDGVIDTIVDAADLVTRARSGVERDRYSRDLQYQPEPESPARLTKILCNLAVGIAVAHDSPTVSKRELALVVRLALDSIPAVRRSVLTKLVDLGDLDTTEIGTATHLPTTTVKRALEDMEALGLMDRHKGSKAHRWTLLEEFRTSFHTLQMVADSFTP
jgi:hypothetical protein